MMHTVPGIFLRQTTAQEVRLLPCWYSLSLYLKMGFKMFTNRSHTTMLTFTVLNDRDVPVWFRPCISERLMHRLNGQPGLSKQVPAAFDDVPDWIGSQRSAAGLVEVAVSKT